MKISFDPAKDEWTKRECGLSLALGAEIITNSTIRFLDERFDYGEDRVVAYGYVQKRLYACIIRCAVTCTTSYPHERQMIVRPKNTDEDFAAQDALDNPDWTTVKTKPFDSAIKLHHTRILLEMSQADFASMLGIPVATLRNWEQRRTQPDSVASTLIDLVYDDPEGMKARLQKRKAAA